MYVSGYTLRRGEGAYLRIWPFGSRVRPSMAVLAVLLPAAETEEGGGAIVVALQ